MIQRSSLLSSWWDTTLTLTLTTVFFLVRIISAIHGLFCFHMNFRLFSFSYVKNESEILVVVALEL